MRLTGINYCDYYGLSPYEFAAAIKSCGFDAAFTDSDNDIAPSAFAKAFYENGIAWETIHAPFKGINEIWKNGESGDQILAKLKTTVDICAEFSVPTAVIHLSSGEKAPSISDIGKARFSLLVEHAVRKNVSLAFENQRKLANIAWVFEEFSSVSNVGFCWDVGHEACFANGREYMPLFGNKLLCTHIHDNDGRHNHDLHQIPFDGKLDFYRIARHIRDYGFAGTLMLEIFPQISGIYGSLKPEEILLRANAAVSRLRDMVDRK
jgi:sugar phosphate isomerase/epimerase